MHTLLNLKQASSSSLASAVTELKPAKRTQKSGLVSRNVTIGTHRTSVRLEPDMWNALRDICRREHVTVHDIATIVAVRKSPNSSLTAAIRVFVMAYFRMASTEDGHSTAGHGPGGSFMRSLVQKKVDEQDDYDTKTRMDRLAMQRELR